MLEQDLQEKPIAVSNLSTSQVKELQANLKKIKLYSGDVDGIAGEKTKKAWAQFKTQVHQSYPHLVGYASYQLLLDQVSKMESSSLNSKVVITREQFDAFFSSAPLRVRNLKYKYVNEAMLEFNINTPRRAAAYLAQIAQESGNLIYSEEIASGRAYEGRADLGNVKPGDGVRFKGRGDIQLTGRANYRKYGKILNLPLESNPKLAALPENASRIAAAFWETHGLNELADQHTVKSFTQITRKINGGYNHLQERLAFWQKAKRILKC